MDSIAYHRFWTGYDPTPRQARLYVEKKHGFFSSTWNHEEFLATFTLAMYLTHDEENDVFRQVLFTFPKILEPLVTSEIQSVLNKLKIRLCCSKPPSLQKALRKHILDRLPRISLGSRVYGIREPPSYWVAYGFAFGTLMPQWLQDGLIE
jgi:hypothetical protein